MDEKAASDESALAKQVPKLPLRAEGHVVLEQGFKGGIAYRATGQSDDFLSTLKPYRYLPQGLTQEGLLAWQFIQACKAESIPESKWPNFEIDLPDVRLQIEPPPFPPPAFNVGTDTQETYRRRCLTAFRKHYSDFLRTVHRQIQLQVQAGFFIPLRRRRGSGRVAPLELRLRWAALHCCMGRSYGKLNQQRNPRGKYTLLQITRATQRLLDELGLRKRHEHRL